jgi:hypothetical protein
VAAPFHIERIIQAIHDVLKIYVLVFSGIGLYEFHIFSLLNAAKVREERKSSVHIIPQYIDYEPATEVRQKESPGVDTSGLQLKY